MATLGLKEMGKFLWEGREKSLPSWLSQFSFAEFFWKMQRKTWYSILGLDPMPLSLKNLLLIQLPQVEESTIEVFISRFYFWFSHNLIFRP